MCCSVIIATLGRPQRLRLTLASLLECHPLPDEIIVVDGEPSEETRAVADDVRSTGASTHLVYISSPRGSTIQRNAGLRIATSPIVVFVDDDMDFGATPDLFSRIEQAFSRSDVVGVTGHIVDAELRRYGQSRSRIRRLLFRTHKEGSFTRFGYPRYVTRPERELEVEYMRGGLMCVRLDIAREVGFDENLTCYAIAEDEDFSYRVSRKGTIRYVPEIVIQHERYGARSYRDQDRALVVNRRYLFRKNFEQTPLAEIEFWLFVGLLMTHRLVNRDWAGLRGLVEGTAAAARGHVPGRADAARPQGSAHEV